MAFLMNTKNTKHPKPIEATKRARQATAKTDLDDGSQVIIFAPTADLVLKIGTSIMYTQFGEARKLGLEG